VQQADENQLGYPVHPSVIYRFIHVVPFVSKQDTKTLLYMAQAVRDDKLVIPIHRKLPLGEAAKGHSAVEKDGTGKVLLLA
jgi:hypothetical protein